jgi:hypothetical protein
MKAVNKQAVVKADPDNEKPAYLVALESKGRAVNQDNFDKSDLVVPKIKLLQGTSPEIEAFADAKPGIFWHTGFDMPLGNELLFTICSRNKKMLLVAPLHDGQGILARSEDCRTWNTTGSWEVSLDPKNKKATALWTIDTLNVEDSDVAKWGSSNPEDKDSPPAATLFYDYLILLPDHREVGPSVLSLARSQIKKAKKGLNDKIELHASAGRPMQALVFKATVVSEQGPAGPYYNYQFQQSGFADQSIYEEAKEMATVLRTFRVSDEASDLDSSDRPKASSEEF